MSDASEVITTPQYKHCARVCAVNKQTFCVGYDNDTTGEYECHTNTAYWMIDCCFLPDQSQNVTLSDSIKVT